MRRMCLPQGARSFARTLRGAQPTARSPDRVTTPFVAVTAEAFA